MPCVDAGDVCLAPRRHWCGNVTALGEILRRFRFHGVPGAPGAAGAEVERAQQIERELEPVFAALDRVQRRAQGMLAEAHEDAERARSDALVDGRRLVDEALVRAARVRAEAVASCLADAARERRRLLAAAEEEAARVRSAAAHRLPPVVAVTLERVVSSLQAMEGPRSTTAGAPPDETTGVERS